MAGEAQQRLVAREQVAGAGVAGDFEEFLVVAVAALRQCRAGVFGAGDIRGRREAAAVAGEQCGLDRGGKPELRVGEHAAQFLERVVAAAQHDAAGVIERAGKGGQRGVAEMPQRHHRIGVEHQAQA